MISFLMSIIINALVVFIVWSSGAKVKNEQNIMEVEFLSPTANEQEEMIEPEPELESDPKPEFELDPEPEPKPIPEPESGKGKVFTVPVEESTPDTQPDDDSISSKKKEDKTEKEAKSESEIAYKAQKFKYEAYAKQVHQKLRQYLPWLKKMCGGGHVVVKFAVHRDGTTSHISILESSGNSSFDEEVIKIIEEEIFDNLPSDYEKNILVTAFEFRVGVDN